MTRKKMTVNAKTKNEDGLTAAELSGDVGEVHENIGTIIEATKLPTPTKLAIVTQLGGARFHVSDLKTTLEKQLKDEHNVNLLNEDAEVLLRNAHGASNRFLVNTEKHKLEKLPKKPRSKDPKLEDGWVTLRFRITEAQRDIVDAAMKRAKEISEIKGKLWKGVALEWVASDFLAGHGYPGEGQKGGYAEGEPGNIEETVKQLELVEEPEEEQVSEAIGEQAVGEQAVKEAFDGPSFKNEQGLSTPWPIPVGGRIVIKKPDVGFVTLVRFAEKEYQVTFLDPKNNKEKLVRTSTTSQAALEAWLSGKGYNSIEHWKDDTGKTGSPVSGGVIYWVRKETVYDMMNI